VNGFWHQIFDFSDYGALLVLVRNSLIAGLALGIVAGVVSVFVMMRDLPFAVHGISELSLAGAAGALLLGMNVVAGSLAGSLIAAVLIGLLGVRARDRNSIIGVLMPFGPGLGVLFLSLYQGRSANKFGLLTGHAPAATAEAALVEPENGAGGLPSRRAPVGGSGDPLGGRAAAPSPSPARPPGIPRGRFRWEPTVRSERGNIQPR